MAHYTFDIIKYTLITEEGETYKDFIEMMPSLTVQATNYIAATLKAEKAYPSDKYVHQLIDTEKRLEQYVVEQRKICGVSDVLPQDTPTKTVQHYGKGHRDDGKRRLWI